jgi:hypothetical protein
MLTIWELMGSFLVIDTQENLKFLPVSFFSFQKSNDNILI